jgi:hypothetical protein
MSSSNISLDPDQALTSVTKLIYGQEVVIHVADQVESHGTSVGPAATFKQALDAYVTDIRIAMGEISKDLIAVQDKITKTVAELAEKDSDVAEQAATFTQGVEAVTELKNASAAATNAINSVLNTSKITAIG